MEDIRYQTYIRKNDRFVASNAFNTKKWAKDFVRNADGSMSHDAGYVVDGWTHEIVYQYNAKEYIAKMI